MLALFKFFFRPRSRQGICGARRRRSCSSSWTTWKMNCLSSVWPRLQVEPLPSSPRCTYLLLIGLPSLHLSFKRLALVWLEVFNACKSTFGLHQTATHCLFVVPTARDTIYWVATCVFSSFYWNGPGQPLGLFETFSNLKTNICILLVWLGLGYTQQVENILTEFVSH